MIHGCEPSLRLDEDDDAVQSVFDGFLTADEDDDAR